MEKYGKSPIEQAYEVVAFMKKIEGLIKNLPQKDLFRPDEVANYFEVTPRTVRNWIQAWKEEGLVDKFTRTQGGQLRIYRQTIIDIVTRTTND